MSEVKPEEELLLPGELLARVLSSSVVPAQTDDATLPTIVITEDVSVSAGTSGVDLPHEDRSSDSSTDDSVPNGMSNNYMLPEETSSSAAKEKVDERCSASRELTEGELPEGEVSDDNSDYDEDVRNRNTQKYSHIMYKITMKELSKLIRTLPDINHKDEEKSTLLHQAVFWNRLELCQFLLENGADINAIDANRATPIFHAIQRGDGELVRFLIKKGANIHVDSFYGRPIHYIFSYRLYGRSTAECHKELAEIFIEAGAGPDLLVPIPIQGGKLLLETRGVTPLAEEVIKKEMIKQIGLMDLNYEEVSSRELIERIHNFRRGNDGSSEQASAFASGSSTYASGSSAFASESTTYIRQKMASTGIESTESNPQLDFKVLIPADITIDNFIGYVRRYGINAKDKNGASWLHIASGIGRTDLMMLLFDTSHLMEILSSNRD